MVETRDTKIKELTEKLNAKDMELEELRKELFLKNQSLSELRQSVDEFEKVARQAEDDLMTFSPAP